MGGVIFMEISGVAMVLAALIPGGAQLASDLVLADPGPESAAMRLWTGIAGALLAGWAVCLWMLIKSTAEMGQGGQTAERVVGRSALAGIAIWFVLDSIVSLWVAAPVNVGFNLLYLIVVGVPCWRILRVESSNAATVGSPPQSMRT